MRRNSRPCDSAEPTAYNLRAGGHSAFARIQFDWNAGAKRPRSMYVVLYRYQSGLIRQQELYSDPSGTLAELPTDRV